MAVIWRKKVLPVSVWGPLQDSFGELQMATGAPANLAMFVKSRPGTGEEEIYITGPGIAAIEARSPGGWEDADKPTGEGVSLLVGRDDPWELFGIGKP